MGPPFGPGQGRARLLTAGVPPALPALPSGLGLREGLAPRRPPSPAPVRLLGSWEPGPRLGLRAGRRLFSTSNARPAGRSVSRDGVTGTGLRILSGSARYLPDPDRPCVSALSQAHRLPAGRGANHRGSAAAPAGPVAGRCAAYGLIVSWRVRSPAAIGSPNHVLCP
jgi:hypothetical protein